MTAVTEITEEVRQRMLTELTAPGQLFEVTMETISGITYKVFKQAPKNLKGLYALGMDRESFISKAINNPP